jgi:hypothetical protein
MEPPVPSSPLEAGPAEAAPQERRSLRAWNRSRGTLIAGRVAVANGLWRRAVGLIGRAALAPDEGLWLPGTSGIHMAFMRFPIDALFLGPDEGAGRRRVVAVHHHLRPWVGIVPLVRGARGVLELPAGRAAASGTRAGDEVVLEDPFADPQRA